jgi:hypothetical protein
MQQLPLSLANQTNAILVDGLAIGRLLSRLSCGYHQQDAHDLYELIVQVILRDRVWWLPTSSTPDSIELLRPWFQHGTAIWLPRGNVRQSTTSPRGQPSRSLGRASKFVQTALHNDIPCLVTSDQRAHFAVLAAPELENAVCDLLGQYNSLEQRVRVGMIRRGVSKPHLVRLRIPPLPFEVMRRSSSIAEIVTRTLEVRDEFRSIRRDLAETSAILSDTTVSPNRKLRQITSLERSWRAVQKLADGAVEIDHAKSGGYVGQLLLSGAQLGAGIVLSEIGSIIGGVAGIGHAGTKLTMPSITFRRAAWRLQPLGDTFRKSWATTDREMINHLNRIFGPPRF